MVRLAEPLVGRAAERERLDAFLDRLVGGQPQLAVLAGEPGIGKTRLLTWADCLGAGRRDRHGGRRAGERQWTCDARLGHLGS